MRRYWQPIALSEELPQGGAPLRVHVLGEELVLFRDDHGRPGLLRLHCSHRGTDLSYGRIENGGLRCIYHGWLYDVCGRVIEQPGEPGGGANRDQIRHHVYSFSRPKRFELPLYKGEDAPPVLFDKPGVVKIGCNIHDWMSAIILVLPNQRFAVTGEDGTFSLPGLESGNYTITAWHAQAREKTEDVAQRVAVMDHDPQLNFKLSLAPARSRPATRGARWDQ